MKLFHNENGQTVVYVQLQDIMFLLTQTNITIPTSISKKAFTGVTFCTKKGRTVMFIPKVDYPIPVSLYAKFFYRKPFEHNSTYGDFEKFDKDSEVSFFKTLDFIIDYDEYKGLNDEQLEQRYNNFVKDLNHYIGKLDKLSENDIKSHLDLYFTINNLEYVLNSITEIYNFKHNKKNISFPDFFYN